MQPMGFITHTIDISTITHIFSRQSVQYADGVRDRVSECIIIKALIINTAANVLCCS